MGAMTLSNHDTYGLPPIEASSLANVLAIADSPPAKPSAKRHGGKPLELYIARVPGSRDVFLTTLKPRDKVVTAQDVESSLYYCHLETENDELFRHEDDYFSQNPDHHKQDVSSSPDEPTSPTSRGRAASLPPVPEPGFEASMDELHLTPALPPRPDELGSSISAIKRKPLNSNIGEAVFGVTASAPILPPRPLPLTMPMPLASVLSPNQLPSLPPRPMGPRPLADRRQSENNVAQIAPITTDFAPPQIPLRNPPEIPRRPVSIISQSPALPGQKASPLPYPLSPTENAGKESVDMRGWTADRPPPVPAHNSSTYSTFSGDFDGQPWLKDPPRPALPPRPMSLSRRSTNSFLNRSNSLVANIPAGIHSPQTFHSGFNVTLIRRNPSDGTQSNVAKISIPAFTTSPRNSTPSKCLLQIFTPSYHKFRTVDSATTASLVRCISEDDDCTYSTDLRLATRRRSIKSPTSPYFGDVPVNQMLSVSPSQPYSFVSPWGRVCEFTTGVGGRSLKCRHMLARGTILDEDPNRINVCQLSELRFNTPSTKLWAKGSRKQGAEARRPGSTANGAATMAARPGSAIASASAVHRKSVPAVNAAAHAANHQIYQHQNGQHQHGIFHTQRRSHDSSIAAGSPATFASDFADEGNVFDDDQDWDVEPMDLSLGQERAGGGLKGNKAKLGKLVIEPEGLEMLDLLVAANMGIWWNIR